MKKSDEFDRLVDLAIGRGPDFYKTFMNYFMGYARAEIFFGELDGSGSVKTEKLLQAVISATQYAEEQIKKAECSGKQTA